MAKYRAIPQGFMTIGEVAKKMDVTVRTLQYYDCRTDFPGCTRVYGNGKRRVSSGKSVVYGSCIFCDDVCK